MKRDVLILIILSLIILTGCVKKQEQIKIEDSELSSLKEKYSDVKMVKAVRITEGGRICYDVTEYKDNIYNSLVNMKILEETSERVTDSGLSFIFVLNDNTSIPFSFEAGSYIKGNKHYKIAKTSYEIEYDKEIGCDYNG